jgi:hypothetical protein
MQLKTAKISNEDKAFHFLMLFGIIFVLFFIPHKVTAGMILDAELKLTYEDNVVGLLSDQRRIQSTLGGGMPGGTAVMAQGMGGMGPPSGGNNSRYTGAGSSTNSPGDFSATVYGEVGGYTPVTNNADIFAKGFAGNQTYNTYTDLNETLAGASAGIAMNFNSSVSGRAAIFGKVKRFGDSQRDSTSYGGTLGLKEKLTTDIWLKEFVEYEKNDANSPFFTFKGITLGVAVGYSVTKQTLLSAGYSYLIEKYDQPSGADIKENTVSLNAEYAFAKSWVLAGQYDLQLSKVSATGTYNTDNIFSVAMRYYY